MLDKIFSIIDKIIPDPKAKLDFIMQMLGVARDQDKIAQDGTNVPGWKRLLCWSATISILYHYVFADVITWSLNLCGANVYLPPLPQDWIETCLPILGYSGILFFISAAKGLKK